VIRRFVTVAVALVALGLPAAAMGASAPVLVGSQSNSTTLSGTVSVAVSGQTAYTTAYWPGQLTALDISNPGTPSNPSPPPILGETTATAALENGSGVTIVGSEAYVVSKNRNASSMSNDDGSGNSLTVVNLTSPNPTVAGSVHDSTELFGAYGIAVQGQFAYVAAQGVLGSPQPQAPDTGTGSFAVINLNNLGAGVVAHLDNNSLPAPWTGQNVLDHANSVAISGHYAYVTAFNSGRVTVIDISNPLSPSIVTSLPDATNLVNPNDLAIQGNYLYVANQADFNNQFTVIDISNPAAPKVVGSLNNSNLEGAYRIRVRGDFAYVSASDAATIAAIDITDPTHPRVAGWLTDTAHLNKTTGLDLDPSGGYVIASSAYALGQPNVKLPPYPGSTGGPTDTGTISMIQLDPNPIAVSIATPSEPPNPTAQTTASFTFSVNDDVSAVQCQLDNGPMGLCSTATTANYSSLSAGSHTFTVQATDSAGNISAPARYTWTVGSAPVNSVRPTVSGSAVQGRTLTASAGTWSGIPAPSFSYQWERCNQTGQACNAISGAAGAGSVYVVQSGDVGQTLVVVVTATNSAGAPTAQSLPTAVVQTAPAAPKNTSLPKVSGTAKKGNRLTGSNGTWSGYPGPSFTYRWERCDSHGAACKTVSGQTKSGYTVASGDLGFTLRFVVVAASASGSSTATSAATAVVSVSSDAARAVTGRAVLTGASSGRPSLRITIPAGRGMALVKSVDVSLPNGIRFSGSKSRLVKEVAVKTAQGKRLGFAAALKHGGLLITFKRATDGVQVVISSRALSVSKHFLASAKGRHASPPQVALTLAETSDIVVHGRLKLRLTP
jgi:hypothetical protein